MHRRELRHPRSENPDLGTQLSCHVQFPSRPSKLGRGTRLIEFWVCGLAAEEGGDGGEGFFGLGADAEVGVGLGVDNAAVGSDDVGGG